MSTLHTLFTYNSSKPFSILILVTQLERAGAQKNAFMQARYLHEQGYAVTLCFFYDKYGLMEEVCQREPYKILNLEARIPGGSRTMNSLRAARALWRLYWLLRHERFQVVETLTHYSNVLGIVVAWLAGVSVRVSSQRGVLIDFPKWFLRLDAWLVNSRLVDKMVAVSEQTRQFCIEVQGMLPQKVGVIPNGINLAEFDRTRWSAQDLDDLRSSLQVPKEVPVLVTVARLHPKKGYAFLIQAASQILAICPDVVFMVIGDGEDRGNIEYLIQQSALSPHFRMLGSRADVPQLLALSDLFVLPSLYEGLPNVILEAMAAKLAVVATDVGGTREVVVHMETGLLVPKADATALAQAILLLLSNEALRQEMGLRGYARVQSQFPEHVMCRRYEELMLSILAEKHRHAD